MPTWVALFRGINVGGRNSISMKELAGIVEDAGYAQVQTYIQSGNVVFDGTNKAAQQLPARVAREIERRHGFRPDIVVLSATDLERAAAANPFRAAEAEPKSLHLYFFSEPAGDADTEGLEGLRSHDEAFVLTDRVLYLHAPSGVGRSKLAASVERLVGVGVTARNWRTVMKLREIVERRG